MRTKRAKFIFTVAVLLLCSNLSVLAGSNSMSKKFSDYNAYGTEFVAFVEGPMTITDKVSYTFSLVGEDSEYQNMPYKAGTPSTLVVNGVLGVESHRYSAEGTNVSAGYGNAYGYASMTIDGQPYEIHATDG